ncbi:MAG: tRNA preQ1(34) S-adenosylmethionine ribosyltransferase-isomerase QueA [Candidatus Nitrospinota bacterium M3_3B_026]
MNIQDFDYHLPPELVAQRPVERRGASRLMVMERDGGNLVHSRFERFPDFLREGDALVINTTKVFPARLSGRRATGGAVEILLTRRDGPAEWTAMTRGLGKARPGEALTIGDGLVVLAKKLGDGMAALRFSSAGEADRIIKTFGDVPLPPYIRRPEGRADETDRERYQTIFAEAQGSCAAPTAGLHFTENILAAVKDKGGAVEKIVLHVGPGTFRPVRTERIEDHVMDPECYEISEQAADSINRAREAGGRIVAVGSTVTRALESAADEEGRIRPGAGETSLFIAPGCRFRAVDALLTNFHLPKSTLLILVCAFAGREAVLRAYEEAAAKGYRFYSYGDAMLIV